MRASTIVLLLCLSGAVPVWGQPARPGAAAATGDPPAASEAKKTAESPPKEESPGFWNWLRTGSTTRSDVTPAERLERPDRMERPLRVDRPERAGGGCCQ